MDISNMGSQLGLINSLRTGNVVLDMLICMCIPLLFQLAAFVATRYSDFFVNLMERIRTNENVCMKTLEYEFRTNMYGSVIVAGNEERNNILQKALTLYIADMVKNKSLPKRTLPESKLSFMAVKETSIRNDQYG